ncbi:MAG: hypothetical protein WAK20_13705, partial [Candidatus Acidiferrum sp.]
MIRRAKLYARIAENGSYSRVAVAHDRNGRPIEPRPKKGHVTAYQVRIAGKFFDAGSDFASATNRLRQEQARLSIGVPRTEAETAPVVHVSPESGEPTDRTRIVTAAEEFVAELQTLDRKKYSVAMYKNALRDFQASCRKEFLDQIDRKDILNFVGWMRENMQVRVPGSENRTYKNKLNFLGTFLGRHGIQLRKKGNGQSANDPGLLYR